MGKLQIVVLFIFLENHCKFEDENENEEEIRIYDALTRL